MMDLHTGEPHRHVHIRVKAMDAPRQRTDKGPSAPETSGPRISSTRIRVGVKTIWTFASAAHVKSANRACLG
jgi:hypothetical protein